MTTRDTEGNALYEALLKARETIVAVPLTDTALEIIQTQANSSLARRMDKIEALFPSEEDNEPATD